MTGSAFNDVLTGSAGANVIRGLDGNDVLTGGGSGDTLVGGLGADRFVLTLVTDSRPGTPDVIVDFVHGADIIDLSALDANTSSKAKGDQAFGFGGQSTAVLANGVTWLESSGNTIVQADVNGDASADLTIVLTGINLNLSHQDFLL